MQNQSKDSYTPLHNPQSPLGTNWALHQSSADAALTHQIDTGSAQYPFVQINEVDPEGQGHPLANWGACELNGAGMRGTRPASNDETIDLNPSGEMPDSFVNRQDRAPDFRYSFHDESDEPWSQLHMHSNQMAAFDSVPVSRSQSQQEASYGQPFDYHAQNAWPAYDQGHPSHPSSVSGSFAGPSRRPDMATEGILTSDRAAYSGEDEWVYRNDTSNVDDELAEHSMIDDDEAITAARYSGSSELMALQLSQTQLYQDAFPENAGSLSPSCTAGNMAIDERFPNFPATNVYDDQSPYDENLTFADEFAGHLSAPASATALHGPLAGSWPPSRDDLQDRLEVDDSFAPPRIRQPQIRQRGATIGSSVIGGPGSSQSIPLRPRKRNIRKSRSNSMADAHNPTGSLKVNARKGGRTGKLSAAQAIDVATKRSEKSVCIGCRLRRVKCERPTPDSPCHSCASRGQLCARATITDISEHNTCNCIFQTFSVYPTVDGSRKPLHYPSTFDVPSLHAAVNRLKDMGDAEVRPFTGGSWVIDLQQCAKNIGRLNNVPHSRRFHLQEMFSSKRDVVPSWLKCIRLQGDQMSTFDQFHSFTNMPSRNTYGLIARNSPNGGRHLEVQDPEDEMVIRVLISLCRIVLRALEMTALKELQKNLEQMSRGSKSSAEIRILIEQTALILGSLRWRLAWWDNIETGHNNVDFTHRTFGLARALYFWHFAALNRLSPLDRKALPSSHIAVYADVGQVEDDHPKVESQEAFLQWMHRPREIIQDGQLQGRLPIFRNEYGEPDETAGSQPMNATMTN